MMPLHGVGGVAGQQMFNAGDLVLPGPLKEIGEQWVFGRTVRADLDATADELAGQGIRYAAAFRQAALENLFAHFITGAHHAALDDAQVVLTDDTLIADPECQALHLSSRESIEALRQPNEIVEEEMRHWIRTPIQQILAGPFGQWRTLLAAKFAQVAAAVHEVALADLLERDLPTEHPTCQPLLNLTRAQVAGEQF